MAVVFLSLVNFLLFLTAGRLSNCGRLSTYTIASMGIALLALILHAPAVINGVVQLVSCGV